MTETKPLTDSDVAELADQLRASLSGRKTRKRHIVEITPRTSCGHEATIDALTGELAEARRVLCLVIRSAGGEVRIPNREFVALDERTTLIRYDVVGEDVTVFASLTEGEAQDGDK